MLPSILPAGRQHCARVAGTFASRTARQQQQRGSCHGRRCSSTTSASALEAAMRTFQFCGDLRYATNAAQARAWLDELLQLADSSNQQRPLVVGFDSEVPVVWGAPRASGRTSTALLQLCYHPPTSEQPICLMLQLSTIGGLPRQMQQVLAHPAILKAGIGIAEDMRDVLRDWGAVQCPVQSMVDLNQLAWACGVARPPSPGALARRARLQQQGLPPDLRKELWGLAGLLNALTGHELKKNRRITASNWAKVPLSAMQRDYAAADAYAGLVIYHALWLFWLHEQQQQQQPDSSSSSSSSSSADNLGSSGAAAVAAEQLCETAAAISKQVLQPGQQPQRLLFRGPDAMNVLSSSRVWQSYGPAVALQQQWQQQMAVSHRSCLSRMKQLQKRDREAK